MSRIVVSPFNVACFPEAGGHFWVYMQYIAALKARGCEVFWLEEFLPSKDLLADDRKLATFQLRMREFGLDQHVILYRKRSSNGEPRYLNIESKRAERILREADLLINFHYTMSPAMLSMFRRTAVVDIDPGLLQFWVANGQLDLAKHDFYFTTGETVGTERALFSDLGVPWIHIRPGVFFDLWPFRYQATSEAFTTVSSWWGEEYITDGGDILYENNKRVTFLDFDDLPHRTDQPIELALSFGDDEAAETQRLQSAGWRVIHARAASESPQTYQAYIQSSRGEFSCVKPSCIKFQNAWISDRTLCYMASGKPVVFQNTGPSGFLPEGRGLFRFTTADEVVDAFSEINRNYAGHCKAAREIVEEYFDSTKAIEILLNTAL